MTRANEELCPLFRPVFVGAELKRKVFADDVALVEANALVGTAKDNMDAVSLLTTVGSRLENKVIADNDALVVEMISGIIENGTALLELCAVGVALDSEGLIVDS